MSHGFSQLKWEEAKKEAKAILQGVAQRESTITYSELSAQISSIDIEAHNYAFNCFLGEISTEEYEAGRGMMTVLVVLKGESGKPGSGFFELAKDLGEKVSNPDKFWLRELKKVYRVWK